MSRLATSPLVFILRAAHASGTHHRFALDALPLMQTGAGKRLSRLLTRYHSRYLDGAMDPDTRFCDFQNHLIHVNEGYWGGAPRVAHRWYDRLLRYLRDDRLGDAAHAAGVLSHYFTDVMQPLHTGVGDRERIIHGPLECSVRACYDAIYRGWQDDEMRVVFQLADRSEWLGEAMLHGARFAHRKRELLLTRFSIERFTDDPASALDGPCRAALSELFGLAITGLARVLERAADDAEAIRVSPIPRVSLTIPTLTAATTAPFAFASGRITAGRQVYENFALIDEYQRTGDLQDHLPSEVDIAHRVIKIHHDEVNWKRERERRLASAATVVRVDQVVGDRSPATIPFVQNPATPVSENSYGVATSRPKRRRSA